MRIQTIQNTMIEEILVKISLLTKEKDPANTIPY